MLFIVGWLAASLTDNPRGPLPAPFQVQDPRMSADLPSCPWRAVSHYPGLSKFISSCWVGLGEPEGALERAYGWDCTGA